MTHINRRDLLATIGALGLVPSAFALNARHGNSHSNSVFAHGVASGDPLHDRVILWTKITPQRIQDSVEGRWLVALDLRMRRTIRRGAFETDISRDFTVKIDADGLVPDRTYYYQFETRGARSAIGRHARCRLVT